MGEFKINLHLSYRGFSLSDSSWVMCTQEHQCQQCLSFAGLKVLAQGVPRGQRESASCLFFQCE